MDILDPLDQSENEDVECKVIHHTIDITEKQSIDSDDEQNVVSLSPQTLLETPENEVQYSIRSPEGMITYRVLQVDEGVDSVSQIVTTGPGYPLGTSQQVLTSNINGQLYVIGNTNEVYTTQSGTRAIAPRSAIVETNSPVVAKRRDERRRATHNEVERRRRDKINNWITKLSKIIPETNAGEIKGNGHFDGQSKGGILAKACDYITELKESEGKLNTCMKENKIYAQNVEALKSKTAALERENRVLRELLKRNGIEVSDGVVS